MSQRSAERKLNGQLMLGIQEFYQVPHNQKFT